jgi:hypothetical protein
MEIKRTKKTKQQQVFEILDKEGYIYDAQTAKIFGEAKLYSVSEHIRIWKRLKSDQEFFANKKITEKKKGHRCHLVHVDGEPKNSYYRVGKEFFNLVVVSQSQTNQAK